MYLTVAVAGFVVFHQASQAGQWHSTLYPENWNPSIEHRFDRDAFLQDYSYAGFYRGERSIPNVKGPVFDVTSAEFGADPSGAKDSTAAIQKAIDRASAAKGGVVFIPAGTFSVSVSDSAQEALKLKTTGVVIRGVAGGGSRIQCTTHLMRSKTILRIEGDPKSNWNRARANSVPITRDLLGPTTEIPVEDARTFKRGDYVLVRMTVTPAWVKEHHEPDWEGVESKLGGIVYFRQVVRVDASKKVIQIDVPTRYELKTRDSARLEPIEDMVHEVGVENVAFGNVELPGETGWAENDFEKESNNSWHLHSSSAVSISRVRDSWVKNVTTFKPEGAKTGAHLLSNGILANHCRGLTLLGCKFGHPQYGGGGGNGYMYRLSNCNESLVRDCIASFSRHGFVLSGMGSSGNVFLNCLDEDGGLQTAPTGRVKTAGFGSDHHMHFSHSNLFDGCLSRNSNFQAAYRPYGSPPKHNITASHSAYWSTRGEGVGGPVVITAQARLGYVIGTSGPRSDVSIKSLAPQQTDPPDFVEGVGKGESLVPKSLYSDQVSRRLKSRR